MPTAALPQPSDFPRELQPVVYLPPNSKPSNVILFLPGLGDTADNFASFAKALNLPDSVAVTLQPPFPLPFPIGPGQNWSEDLHFDKATGELDADSPLARSAALVAGVLQDVLVKGLNFSPAQIHLFGFGQGGSVALSAVLQSSLKRQSFGGVVSIGGPLPSSKYDNSSTKIRTPVLLLGGGQGALVRDEQSPVKRIRNNCEFVEYHQWKRADDTLPKSRDEALPLMSFLARRLKSTRGVPEGAVELG